MKKSLLALFTLFLSVQIFAQTNIRIGQHAIVKYNPATVPMTNFASVEEGRQIIQNILNAVGRSANFEIRQSTNIGNAAAVAYGGKRYVLYNPGFINALDRRTGNKWASISVMAHEVGHHLMGHTISGQGSNPTIELEADEFSGYALRKMGASLADAQATMNLIASQNGSATHPGKANRLSAIEEGWESAGGQTTPTRDRDVARTERPTRTVQNPGTTTTRYPTRTSESTGSAVLKTVIDILGQVLLKPNQSRNISSYVTDGLNVFRMINNNWQAVGRLSRTNNSKYPFAIYDNMNTRLFVDRSGNILNSSGQYFGMLKAING
jgi:hypothetical protein